MPAPAVIVDLIERFYQQSDAYKSGQYNEAQLSQIDATDAQIDKLVYELYGLTEGEIKIVEDPSA